MYTDFNPGFSFADGAMKLFVGILLFAIIFYAFMLILKVRVLRDTLHVAKNDITKQMIMLNIFVSIGGGILAFILILL
ncbi:hypothetical protein K8R14_00175 [bacterium]|nr:hypothetical protein [bacterium]